MRRCLVVDDDRDFAENLAEIPWDAGAEAEVTHCGGQALGRVRARGFAPVRAASVLETERLDAPPPHRGPSPEPFDTTAPLEAVEGLHRKRTTA